MKELPVRKGMRLEGFDYSGNGAYFITMCVKDGHEMLGKVSVDVGARIARPSLSKAGVIVEDAIHNVSQIYPSVLVDKYVIMPNHVHLILIIQDSFSCATPNNGRAMRAPTISRLINQMKGHVTKQLGYSIWQKLFHDRIIRDEAEYRHIWKYVDENPARWAEDKYHV